MCRFRVLLVGLCLVFVSTVAFATDGVIEINMARATAGGVTTGDTPNFPVTISQSGSYRLTSNLTVADVNTDAIDVNVGDVTIDLNGFAIIGPTVCSGTPPALACTPTGSGIGINGGTHNRITVRNGSVKGMGFSGVELVGSYERIENVRVSQTGNLGMYIGTSSQIVGCFSDSNGYGGFRAGDNVLIQNCTAGSNAVYGIYLEGTGGIVSGCLSQGNGTQGFNVGVQALVTGCVATGNNEEGLTLGANSAYSNCVFAGNNNGGAQVSGGIQIGKNVCNGVACP